MRAAVLLLGVASVALAEDRRDYPTSLVERPMTLPRWLTSSTFEGSFSRLVATDPLYGSQLDGYGAALATSFEVGLPRRLQVGLSLRVPFDPIDFGSLYATLERNLVEGALNFRADLGVEHAIPLSRYALVLGIGLPARIKLHRMIAIVSGSPRTIGFAEPANTSRPNHAVYGLVSQSSDVVALRYFPGYTLGAGDPSCTTGGNPMPGAPNNPWGPGVIGGCGGSPFDVLELSFFVPFGLLFQPLPRLAIVARSGARVVLDWYAFTANGGQPIQMRIFVPFAVDVTVGISRALDVGVSATVLGCVGGRDCGWADLQRFAVWIAGRI